MSELQQVIVYPQEHVEQDISKYDWGKIADQTVEVTVYKKGLVHFVA